MIENQISSLIRKNVNKDFFIDILDGGDRAFKSSSAATKALGLTPRRRAKASGWLRYELLEQSLSDMTEMHGGIPLLDGVMPGTELRMYNPCYQFENVIVSRASISEPGLLPKKNLTRERGTSVNQFQQFPLELRGPLTPKADKLIFVLILTARKFGDLSSAEEVAIAVIEDGYTQFSLYEPLETFIAGYNNYENISVIEPIIKLRPSSGLFDPYNAKDISNASSEN